MKGGGDHTPGPASGRAARGLRAQKGPMLPRMLCCYCLGTFHHFMFEGVLCE